MNKKNKTGLTLVEIMVALCIFAAIAIPAYMFFSYSASSEVEYHKNAAAARIMDSFRNEIKQCSFDDCKTIIDTNSASPDTHKLYEEIQSKYSDLEMEIEKTDVDEKTIKFTLTVTWKNRGGNKKKETSTIVKVK